MASMGNMPYIPWKEISIRPRHSYTLNRRFLDQKYRVKRENHPFGGWFPIDSSLLHGSDPGSPELHLLFEVGDIVVAGKNTSVVETGNFLLCSLFP